MAVIKRILLKDFFLKRYLFNNNISAKEFSEFTGIADPSVRRLIHGRCAPKHSIAQKLREFFIVKRGMSVEDVFDFVEVDSNEGK